MAAARPDLSIYLGPRAHLQQMLSVDRSDATGLVRLPEGCDKAVWLYEHLRELTTELGLLTVALNQTCCEASCPVMCATDQWRFLCAAHKTPKECSAIDYALHTLEGTSAMLCSNKYFPCRPLQLLIRAAASAAISVPPPSLPPPNLQTSKPPSLQTSRRRAHFAETVVAPSAARRSQGTRSDTFKA